jgi:hypothetical protein
MTHEDRPVVASSRSSRVSMVLRPMEIALLNGRGYADIEFRSIAPFRVVASSHKVVRGQQVTAEAMGVDEYDAARKLVRLVTRP